MILAFVKAKNVVMSLAPSVTIEVLNINPVLLAVTVEASATQPSILISSGATIEGGILSITVTVCSHVAILPEASVAVQVTIVSPTGNS